MKAVGIEIQPITGWNVWLGSQAIPDVFVGSFAEAEEFLLACHEGRDHLSDSYDDPHRHHDDHKFAWELEDGFGELREYPPSLMLEAECRERECPCRVQRPLIPDPLPYLDTHAS